MSWWIGLLKNIFFLALPVCFSGFAQDDESMNRIFKTFYRSVFTLYD